MVPPIWEPGVLEEASTRPAGHWCLGVQQQRKQAEKRRGRTPRGYHTLEREGAEVAVSWEKCGRCPGLEEYGVGPVRIDDVPASELDIRQWPHEVPRGQDFQRRGQERRMAWLFQRRGQEPRVQRGTRWNARQGREYVRLRGTG